MSETQNNVFEPQKYPIRSTFGIQEAPEKAEIQGLKPGLHGVPKIDPHYVFEIERLRDLTMFWIGGFRALLLEGDPSAGKTSFIRQWHAKLNVPLDTVACSPDTQSYQMFGQMLPTEDGRLRWHDGPVTRACRLGTSVLLDEYNILEPGQASALNLVLEGYSFTIPETGEVITPAPTTRFFATQNSIDSKAAVTGRNVLDVANEDRFFYMEVDFLKPEHEEALVLRSLLPGGVNPDVAKNIAALTVGVANKVREAFRNGEEAIEKPISTRAVLRWAKLAAMYTPVLKAQKQSGLHYALHHALKMPHSMATAVNEYITLLAGFDENLEQAAP
jgi:cobaltochelatase CobS